MLITAKATSLELEDEAKAAIKLVDNSTACLDFFIEFNLSRATVAVPKPKAYSCDRLKPEMLITFFKVNTHGTGRTQTRYHLTTLMACCRS